jgi:hypothetical protein
MVERRIMVDNRKTFKECYIGDKWIEYTGCSEDLAAYSDIKNSRYLGSSTLCRIDGIQQSGLSIYHYWSW